MKMAALIISLLLISLWGHAQTLDVSVFDGRIGRASETVDERMHEYKRIKKEYRHYLKQRKKKCRAAKDSLKTLSPPTELPPELPPELLPERSRRGQLAKQQEQYYIYTDTLHRLEELASWEKTKTVAKDRSVSKIKEELDGSDYLARYKGLEGEIDSYRKTLRSYRDSLKAIDSLDRDEIRFMVEQKKKALAEEYEGKTEAIAKDIVNEKAPELPGGFENKELAKFKEANSYLSGDMDKDGALKLATAQAGDHFKDKPEALEKAKEQMAKLKKSYSEVPDANDLSTATKASSLKGKRLKDRLVVGGSFQLHVDMDTKVDLNPEISYRVNKKFDIGLGGTYRLTVATKDIPNSAADPKVMGARAFAEHQLIKQFYLHGEYEGLQGKVTQADKQVSRDWYFSVLAGLERRFRLKGKVQGQAQLLYNFSSRDNPLYGSPWVFRVGFGVDGGG
ncbi:hypothetical protein DN752_01425 [Echinicola strongylocentroti]|uniref:Outer membrane protein beta-barrel domain-containing protein n=1 Tax=Echinicola strongylocentroti TaxID=1795355 RepID=A0A2Z4IE13_9BACT|nr:hypothetical protein [Echinicola strongylocentroti]AWW28897.1 hypothetical protein DN752_01425 [Echinicola strongylocentroti]